MEHLKDRFRRTGKKPNWHNGGTPTIEKYPVNPCRECYFCTPRGEHEFPILIDICWNPERVKDSGRVWVVTNRKGKECLDFCDRKQTKLMEFE